jgi:MoaA/NifB/PqqE/SkfB family radical SAM enzyme
MPSNYITVDAINHINAELSNYCNAACPMCARFDHEQKLIPEITNNTHTTLQDMTDKIGTGKPSHGVKYCRILNKH